MSFLDVARLPKLLAQVEDLRFREIFYLSEIGFAYLHRDRDLHAVHFYLLFEEAVARGQEFLVDTLFERLADFGEDLLFHIGFVLWSVRATFRTILL